MQCVENATFSSFFWPHNVVKPNVLETDDVLHRLADHTRSATRYAYTVCVITVTGEADPHTLSQSTDVLGPASSSRDVTTSLRRSLAETAGDVITPIWRYI